MGKKSKKSKSKSLVTENSIREEQKFGRTYNCRMSSGSGDRMASSETGYSRIGIKVSGNVIEIDGKKTVEGIDVSGGIFNVTSVFFAVFFLLSVGFNIIFYAFVRSTESLLVPKIMLGVFALIGFIPLCVNVSRAPMRIRIDLSSYNYIRIIFDSKKDKSEFLSEFRPPNKIEQYDEAIFIADVETKDERFTTPAVVPLSPKRFKVVKDGREEYFSFVRKRGSALSFLYLFFFLFMAMPPLVIISALKNGTFQTGMLSTIMFFVVGVGGMFLPRLLQGNTVTFLRSPHDVTISFTSKKQRKEFFNKLKHANVKTQDPQNSGKKVNKAQKYFVLDEVEKVKEIVPIAVIGTVVAFMFALLIAMIFMGAEVVSIIIFALVTMMFGGILGYIMSNNFAILKTHLYRKKAIQYGDVTYGTISTCESKLFNINSRIYYFVRMMIDFIDEYERPRRKYISRCYHQDMQLCEGQIVPICRYADAYTALDCDILGNSEALAKIKEENAALFYEQNKVSKLEGRASGEFYSLDSTKPFKALQPKIYSLFAIIPLLIFFIGFCLLMANIAINNKDDSGQITGVIFASIIVGLPLFIVTFICLITTGSLIKSRLKTNKQLKNCTVTYGYVTDVEEIVTIVRRKDAHSSRTRTFANITYLNMLGQEVTKSFTQNELTLLSHSLTEGEKVAIGFSGDFVAIMTKYTLKGEQSGKLDSEEIPLAALLIDKIVEDLSPSSAQMIADKLAQNILFQAGQNSYPSSVTIPEPNVAKRKTEVMLRGYITYALILCIVGLIPLVISARIADIIGLFFCLPWIAVVVCGIWIFIKGLKRHHRAKKALDKCNCALAIVYKDKSGGRLFKKVPYIYFDQNGKLQKGYCSEILFQFRYLEFAKKDITDIIQLSQTLHRIPDFSSIPPAAIAVVAYNRTGSTLLRP